MSPADIVITRFGGVRALARLLGKDPSTVTRWRQPKDKGGMDGRVPSAMQPVLLGLAKEKGVQLTATDLVLGSTCDASPAESTAPAQNLS